MNFDTKIMTEVKSVLKRFGDKYMTESGKLKKTSVINDLDDYDKDLMTALFSDKLIHDEYTEVIGDTEVFKLNQFISMFQYKEFWKDSFTKYSNRIGLTSGGKFISDSADVVLDFPYKDTVLKAGMTKEDVDESEDAEEPFLNETLAHSEISELFEPKILVNAKKYDKNGENGATGFNNHDNLFIKGNNLIALHSLKPKFKNKVKLIYLDPPYNTGNDSFQYNDKFNHSTWLTFMKNRLEIMKELLSTENGIICVQCDDNEQAYLKLLMDEVFGRSHFMSTIVVQMSQPTGFKMKHADKRLPKLKEFILVYKMNVESKINIVVKPKDKWDSEYKNILLGISRSNMEFVTKVRKNKNRTEQDVKKVISILKKTHYTSVSTFLKKNKVSNKKDFLYENAWRIFQTVSMPSQNNKKLSEKMRDSLDQVIFPIITPRNEMYIIKGDFDSSVTKPRMKMIFASDYLMVNVCDLWTDIKTTGLDNEGVVKLSNGKKPEALMERLIKMFSNKDDIVLDAFAGTGTTAAVSLKLNRRFITMEQLDSHVKLANKRLCAVINGEQGGISKKTDWQGGGSFVCAELMDKNQRFLCDIQRATNIDDLNKVYTKMKSEADLDFRVDLNKYESDLETRTISFDKKRKILIKMLDKNQLYYNEANIDDEEVRNLVSDADYQFNKAFYGEESN